MSRAKRVSKEEFLEIAKKLQENGGNVDVTITQTGRSKMTVIRAAEKADVVWNRKFKKTAKAYCPNTRHEIATAVMKARAEHPKMKAAIQAVADKTGCNPGTVGYWISTEKRAAKQLKEAATTLQKYGFKISVPKELKESKFYKE